MNGKYVYTTPIHINNISHYWPQIYHIFKELHPGIRWASGIRIDDQPLYVWSRQKGEDSIKFFVDPRRNGSARLSWDLSGYIPDEDEEFEYRNLFDYLNLNQDDFFEPLTESEDKEWYEDVISNIPNLPKYGHKNEYVIHFENVPSIEYVKWLINALGHLGWNIVGYNQSNFRDIVEYRKNSYEAYICLRKDGDVVYGSSMMVFYDANDVSEYMEIIL